MMLYLDDVTLVCIDCLNHEKAIKSMSICCHQCQFKEKIFITDRHFAIEEVETIIIQPIKSKEQYSWFCMEQLTKYIKTNFLLVVQHDGFIVNASKWTDEFYEYDYIGCPWWYTDGMNVGNGGFSLRSARLQKILSRDANINKFHPEDEMIGRHYRGYLEDNHNIKIAPEYLAKEFSTCYSNGRDHNTFGYHGFLSMFENYRPKEYIDGRIRLTRNLDLLL